jgi:hypothetical protein
MYNEVLQLIARRAAAPWAAIAQMGSGLAIEQQPSKLWP